MMIVTDILQDDYGCEERPADWEPHVIVALSDDQGNITWRRVSDRYLTRLGIEIGSNWPVKPDADEIMIK